MATATKPTPFVELRGFQRDLLAILAREGRTYGLGIKNELDELYDEEINHGRLYPNLDELAGMDLITIRELDKRTNEYELTETGRRHVEANQAWLADCLEDGQ